MTSLSEKIADQVGDATEAALNQVRCAVSSAAELGDRAELTQDIAGNFQSALNKSLQDQPRATLAVAAILGFIVGALWKLSR
jgi:ElaB/YqjD/DUF883 family membrane-anchored ribosome-binding protein